MKLICNIDVSKKNKTFLMIIGTGGEELEKSPDGWKWTEEAAREDL